jgi:proline racemase
MTGAALTAPASPMADFGLLFMHAGGCIDFCGHGLIGAVTIALERKLFVPSDSHRSLTVETVAGPVRVQPDIARRDGRVRVARVTYRSHPVHVVAAGARAAIGARDARVDIVWANGLFALVDGEALGIPLVPGSLFALRQAGLALFEDLDLRRSAAAVPAGQPPRFEGVVLLGQPSPGADVRSATVYADGVVDRSPSGSATAAVVSVLDAMGLVEGDRRVVHESLWGTRFEAGIAARREDGARVSLEIDVGGEAWITGEHTFVFDPDDPLRAGLG